MLSCRELVEQAMADPDLLNNRNRRGWQVRLHLLMCRHCRNFSRQLEALVELLSRLPEQTSIDRERVEQIWNSVRGRRAPEA